MSHFATAVFVKDPNDLDKALQPFHEYGCTGINDEYIQNIERIEEAQQEYESKMIRQYKDPNGQLHSPYENLFYREPTLAEDKEHDFTNGLHGTGGGKGLSWKSRDWGDGKGYRTKIHFIPEGWEVIDVPVKESQTFLEFVRENYSSLVLEHNIVPVPESDEHKWGWVQLDKEGEPISIIDRTNPNYKWDWWVIGGRYSGKILVNAQQPDIFADPSKHTVVGEGGVFNPKGNCTPLIINGKSCYRVDGCKIKHIDFEAIAQYNAIQDGEGWDEAKQKADEEYKKLESGEYTRNEWYVEKNMSIKEEAGAKQDDMYGVDPYKTTKDEFQAEAIQRGLSCWAMITLDGEWKERGSMGWFGANDATDESTVDHHKSFHEYIKSLDPETWIIMVDCHT